MQKSRFALRAVTFLGVALAFTSVLHAQMPNPYGSPIPVEKAKLVAAAAAAEAQKNGWTMAISIVDSSGELAFFEKMDATQLGSIQLSMAKARSAVLFKRPTKAYEDALAAGGIEVRVLKVPDAMPVEAAFRSSKTARSSAPSASPAAKARKTANAPTPPRPWFTRTG
jgi:hypothetical protein